MILYGAPSSTNIEGAQASVVGRSLRLSMVCQEVQSAWGRYQRASNWTTAALQIYEANGKRRIHVLRAVLFLYMILCPHSLQRIGSRDRISFLAPQSGYALLAKRGSLQTWRLTSTQILHLLSLWLEEVSTTLRWGRRPCRGCWLSVHGCLSQNAHRADTRQSFRPLIPTMPSMDEQPFRYLACADPWLDNRNDMGQCLICILHWKHVWEAGQPANFAGTSRHPRYASPFHSPAF